MYKKIHSHTSIYSGNAIPHNPEKADSISIVLGPVADIKDILDNPHKVEIFEEKDGYYSIFITPNGINQ